MDCERPARGCGPLVDGEAKLAWPGQQTRSRFSGPDVGRLLMTRGRWRRTLGQSASWRDIDDGDVAGHTRWMGP